MHTLKTILALVILVSGLQPIVAADLPREELARFRRDAENDPEHLLGAVLGMYYETGEGAVRQDYAEAVKWYRLCAEPGYDMCQLHLARMYGLGKGVTKNLVLAHMWANLAAAQRSGRAVDWRDRFAEEMTAQQIEEAQKLAREWRPAGESSWLPNPKVWAQWMTRQQEALAAWPYWEQVRLPFYMLLCAMGLIYSLLYGGELIISAVAWRKTGKWVWRDPPI